MSKRRMVAIGITAGFALAAPALAQQPQQQQQPQPQQQQRQPQQQQQQQQQQQMPQRGPSGAQAPAASQRTANQDQKFLTEAMQGDLTEVQMGQLAQQKGQSDDVKNFGDMLAKDHGDHARKLQTVAQQMGVTLPSEPSAKQKSDYEKLNKLSGAQFDREFAKHMVDDHKKDISQYQAQAKKPGPLADLAKETIPVLQKHLTMAQSLGKQAPTTGSRR